MEEYLVPHGNPSVVGSVNPFHAHIHSKQKSSSNTVPTNAPVPLQFTGITAQTTGGYSFRRKKEKKGNVGKEDTQEGWATCLKVMTEYDQTLVKGWREEIDGLLIFAGLFSAVATAFCIESYSWLQDDPQDTSTQVLLQISLQLTALNSSSSPQIPSFSPSTRDFHPSNLSVRVNTLWFLSLSASLTAALFGTLVKQWLREYAKVGTTSVRTKVRLRQQRHNNLIKWCVPQIVSLLPILLQMAVVLFLVGIVDFLWSLEHIVAGSVMVFIGVSLSLFFLVSILPLFSDDCPYKSPVVYELIRLKTALGCYFAPEPGVFAAYPFAHSASFSGLPNKVALSETLPTESVALSLDKQALAWTQRMVVDPELVQPIIPCLSDVGREAAFVWFAQQYNTTVRVLVDAVRGQRPWLWDRMPSDDAAAREHLLLVLLDTLKDTEDASGAYLISRTDLLGLVGYILGDHHSPTAYFVSRALPVLLPALNEADMRGEHARHLSKFILHILESPDNELEVSVANIGYIVSWALDLYRKLDVHLRGAFVPWTLADQHAFECASGAAFYALSTNPVAAKREYVHEQYCSLLRSTRVFFEHTTLVEPTVDWFGCLQAISGIMDGKTMLLPVGLIRDAVEKVVFLHRVKWVDHWTTDTTVTEEDNCGDFLTGQGPYIQPNFVDRTIHL